MSSMPLLAKQCLAIGLALAAAACAHAGGAAPRAGVGPVASVGEPAPHAGQWSTPHPGSWCNKGSLVKDLGKGVTLAACKAACGVVNSSCAYVCHADESDQRCMLYSTCPDPMSGKPSGWFTTYQYGRAGGAPWVPPPSPSPPSPSPTPPAPGAMKVHIVGAATVAAHGAKCLDGSPPAYLVREGTGANASKYVVFLEGGGWCFSVSDCEKRRRGGLGSSARFIPGSTKKDYGGVMAISSTTNPDFHGYTMVFVHYCDGSSMSSFRPNPIKTSDGQDMWFRGKANLAAVLDELRQDHGLGEASEVILSGGSAGGLAVYYHLDYVAAFVRGSAPKARVTGFPDAGFFADLKNTKGQYEYRGYYQTADSTCWNTTLSGGTNAACLAANPGGTSWKCLMAEYLTDYIATPMYVMNAAFDVYQVQNVLDVGCVPNNCSATQIAAMVAYRKEYLGSSIAHLVARAPLVGHGAFIDSCLVHEQNVDYCSGGNPHAYNCAGWLTTKVLGVSPQQAYSRWYFGGSGAGTNTSTGKQHTDNYNYNYNLTIDPSAAIGPAPGSNPSCPWNFH